MGELVGQTLLSASFSGGGFQPPDGGKDAATTDPILVPAEFWDKLAAAEQRVLMLDYDGTLAPFTVNRMEATPYPGVSEALNDILAAGHTRVVLISGRLLDELYALLNLHEKPEAWGSHGIEHYFPDGRYESTQPDETTSRALQTAEQWAQEAGYAERLECKKGCVVFHWRGQPQDTQLRLRNEVTAAWKPLLCESLELRDFDNGVELRLSAVNKGSAVNQVLAGAGNTTVAAYLGDDLTDEDAFAALGDRGLKVLVRGEPRQTLAEVRLVPPDEVLYFLRTWHDICRGAIHGSRVGGINASPTKR
jgi:trehalose 6-phosphate phosphatase